MRFEVPGRIRIEMWLRALLLGSTLFLTCTGVSTLMFSEPTVGVQFTQLMHARVGAACVALGTVYLLVHILSVSRGTRPILRMLPWRQVLLIALIPLVLNLLVFPPPLEAHPIFNRLLTSTAIALSIVFVGLARQVVVRGVRSVTRNGVAAFLGAVIAATSGLAVFWLLPNPAAVASKYTSPWFWHVMSSMLTLVLVLRHILSSRQRAVRDHALRRYQWNGNVLSTSLSLSVALGVWTIVGAKAVTSSVRPFLPDLDALVAVDQDFFPTVPSICQQCHIQIVDGWRRSAHALAADNPVFTAMIRARSARFGNHSVRFCLRCHAPHAPDPTRVALDVVTSSAGYRAGVHCMSCHRTNPGPLPRDGSLIGFPRAADPVTSLAEHAEADLGISLDNAALPLISSRLDSHRRLYRFASHSPELCRPCHVQSLSEPSHGRFAVLLQDQYGSWSTSPAAAQGRDCKGCHLPRYRSDGDEYQFADHRFLAASTYIAAIMPGEPARVADVVSTLRGHMPTFGSPLDGGVAGDSRPLLEMTVERAPPDSQSTVLLVTTENRGRIGHSFPNGPTDLLEVWLSIRGVDATGRIIVDLGRDRPPGALRLGSTFEDAAGNPIHDHRLEDISRIVEHGTIPASGRFEVRVPIDGPAVFPVHVVAEWHYRRLNPEVVASLTGMELDLPIVPIARFEGDVG
ncbi:MAG: hypothetical protein HY270_15345 [Deltaproteobacteria bacterium]|nr:hypothetical protein [Deltaproteobacteria bacterium]